MGRVASHGLDVDYALPRDVFRAEVEAWASRIKVRPHEIHIRPMKRKWRSCSATGRLTFNAELLTRPAELRRRVIVEELLHLKVPNHGRLFRSLLSAYLNRGHPRGGHDVSDARP